MRFLNTFLSIVILGANASMGHTDEGMWLLNAFPTAQVSKKYGFRASPQWLDHVRLSSARLAGGCSASFVSPHGLVMTNHHCAHSCIEQLSEKGQDYVTTGFYAKTEADEVRCPEIEVNRLLEIKDVSTGIQSATRGKEGQAFNDAQKAAMAKLEKDCSGDSEGVRCEVVTLYHGGKYHLYKYRRFQDVRLVFAPEFAIAFFGGDPDNFMFPRYDLDLSFLRVYSEGKPLVNDEFFKWSQRHASEGELTFVTGHPGKTSRLLTVAELEFIRDVQQTQTLLFLSELRGTLTEFQNRGPEQKRVSGPKLFGVENTLKAYKGRHAALLNPDFFAKKRAAESRLRKKITSNPKFKATYGSAWDEIERAQKTYREIYTPYIHLEKNRDLFSKLFGIAKVLVRATEELPKPNSERLREFTDAKLPELKQELFSTAPIYPEFEIAMLTFSLTKMREALTVDHPAIKNIFGKRSPNEIAQSIVKGTTLNSVAIRKALFEGGAQAVLASQDPLIQFAVLMDKNARAIRKIYENQVESTLKKNGELIAKAQFAVYGTDTYPDATFTLRASYGKIAGYTENGHTVSPITTIQGAFERHTGRDPFALPESWIKAQSYLNPTTPMNFCSTHDIIGGNSGSPVINRDAEIVGLIFDGNIQSLGGDFGFDEKVNRAVAVHSAVILEALDKVYGANRITNELTRGSINTK